MVHSVSVLHLFFTLLCISSRNLQSANAFQLSTQTCANRISMPTLPSSSRLFSESPENPNNMGATERLLIRSAEQRQQGMLQEYGKTVKNDGLDGVRAAVWALFEVSQVVFGVLGVLLTMGLFLNVMGMGYYWDCGLVVDSLQHIHQEQQLQQEAVRLATEAGNKIL